MKNEELEKLQDLSKQVVDGIPVLLLRGDGRFLNDGKVMASSEIMEKLHAARIKAIELGAMLNGQKRRTLPSRKP